MSELRPHKATADINIFLPDPAKFGFPAEIRIIIPPIVSIKTAKGVAI